ncbi:MAG: hypothetical protein ABH864_06755 [archaeon]
MKKGLLIVFVCAFLASFAVAEVSHPASQIHVDTGGGACSAGTCVECAVSSTTGGVTMVNGTELEIYGAILNRGNHTANNGVTGQEQLYFCIPSVPAGLISQSYSTSVTGSDAWKVQIG